MTNLIDKANANLKAMFNAKHVDITLENIEKVYDRNVLSINVDAKTKKGMTLGYLTGVIYLAPASLSGVKVCVKSSPGCRESCLFSAGRGRFYTTTRQRVIKTLAYHLDKTSFINTVKKSIRSLIVKARNKNMIPVVRLNGTSDILWESETDIIQSFPNIQFYDYSKIVKRLMFDIPSNYHLTFSLSECNASDAKFALSRGANVAAVFASTLPARFMGVEVVNGDETDLRFLDGQGIVVGLKAKGKAKKDATGFVQRGEGVKIDLAPIKTLEVNFL